MYVNNNLKETLIQSNDKNINHLRKDQYFENTFKEGMKNKLRKIVLHPEHNKNNTISESIMASILRDLTMIWLKLKVVIVPYVDEDKVKELKQYDLWGPFIMCLSLGLYRDFFIFRILSLTSKKDSGVVFTTVFVIIWIGSMIINLNTKLLGGKMTLMQCICLLGYCLFPLNVAALMVRVFFTFLPGFFKLIIVAFTFLWSTAASVPFISDNINANKKVLAIYPVTLFFIYLNYFILV